MMAATMHATKQVNPLEYSLFNEHYWRNYHNKHDDIPLDFLPT